MTNPQNVIAPEVVEAFRHAMLPFLVHLTITKQNKAVEDILQKALHRLPTQSPPANPTSAAADERARCLKIVTEFNSYTGRGHEDENTLPGMFARGNRNAVRSISAAIAAIPAPAQGVADFLGMSLIIKEQRAVINRLQIENRLLFDNIKGNEADLTRFNAALEAALHPAEKE